MKRIVAIDDSGSAIHFELRKVIAEEILSLVEHYGPITIIEFSTGILRVYTCETGILKPATRVAGGGTRFKPLADTIIQMHRVEPIDWVVVYTDDSFFPDINALKDLLCNLKIINPFKEKLVYGKESPR